MAGKVITKIRPPTYQAWCESEAHLIDTDGCSAVSGFGLTCCLEHDLGYYYGRDPRDAYRYWREGNVHSDDVWVYAKSIMRDEVDRRFRRCHQAASKFGKWSPFAMWRWAGVRLFASGAWERHRKERP